MARWRLCQNVGLAVNRSWVRLSVWSLSSTLYPQQRIPDSIDCNLKDYQILIIFGKNIPDTTGHQMTVQVPTSPNVCVCTTCGNQNTRNRRRIGPQQPWPQSIRLQCLRCHAAASLSDAVYECWRTQETTGWSLKLNIINGESICLKVFAQRANISNIFCKQLYNWTIG